MNTGRIWGFLIWELMGCGFTGWGIYTVRSKASRPFGFWANAKMFAVRDIKAYNRALGKLWIAYGAVLCLLGIPLLAGQNCGGAVISIIGTMLASIAAMAVYVIGIEAKYRKK